MKRSAAWPTTRACSSLRGTKSPPAKPFLHLGLGSLAALARARPVYFFICSRDESRSPRGRTASCPQLVAVQQAEQCGRFAGFPVAKALRLGDESRSSSGPRLVPESHQQKTGLAKSLELILESFREALRN